MGIGNKFLNSGNLDKYSFNSFINSEVDFKFILFEYFPFELGKNSTEISISLSSSSNPVEYDP